MMLWASTSLHELKVAASPQIGFRSLTWQSACSFPDSARTYGGSHKEPEIKIHMTFVKVSQNSQVASCGAMGALSYSHRPWLWLELWQEVKLQLDCGKGFLGPIYAWV